MTGSYTGGLVAYRQGFSLACGVRMRSGEPLARCTLGLAAICRSRLLSAFLAIASSRPLGLLLAC